MVDLSLLAQAEQRAEKAERELVDVNSALPFPPTDDMKKIGVADQVRMLVSQFDTLQQRLEQVERERDDAKKRVKRLQDECNSWCATHAERRSERDTALARIRELEELRNAAVSDRDALVSALGLTPPGPPDLPQRVEADAEKLSAFEWLMGWLDHGQRLLQHDPDDGLFAADWDCDRYWVAPTPSALCDAIDPDWRDHD